MPASKAFPFEFRNVELQYDSYRGLQVRCRYGEQLEYGASRTHIWSRRALLRSPPWLQQCFRTAGAIHAGPLHRASRRQLLPKMHVSPCASLFHAHRRYLLRVTVLGKGMTPDSKRDFPLWVRNYEKLHEATTPIKVGHTHTAVQETRVERAAGQCFQSEEYRIERCLLVHHQTANAVSLPSQAAMRPRQSW